MQIVGIIIAGGRSQRMGQDKALLEVDGVTQLERCQRLLREVGCSAIFVSRNSDGFICDEIPNKGPLGGLLSVLNKLEDAPYRLLVLPVDMPLITVAALEFLLAQNQAAFFSCTPLPCVLFHSTELRSYLKQRLSTANSDVSVRSLLLSQQAQAIEWPYSYQLQNTNTPQQWRHAIELLGVTL